MRIRAFALAVVVVSVPLVAARAQNTDNGGNNANANASTTASATSADATATASVRPMAGYGYSDPKPTVAPRGHLQIRSGTAHHRPAVPIVAGPVATLPGFEMLPEGGSRFFVELSQTVQVEERRARGTITYVIHNAHVTIHNNTNPLVTVHFNTPASTAHLAQSGHDVLFIISLRAAATPTWKMNPGKEGSTVLNVDFPKGSYISNAAQTTPSPQ